jgi:hypothetical protein
MNQRVLEFVSIAAPLQARSKEQGIDIKDALQELYLLLEDYAPVWYTQEHHDRALRALLQRES